MGLKLRKIANSMTVAVNPNYDAVMRISNGYDVADDGTQIPLYEEHKITLQLQSASSADLHHFGYGNIQGVYMVAYGNEFFEIIDRVNQTGNAVIDVPKYGEKGGQIYTWQVIKNAEPWFNWSKALLQLIGKAQRVDKYQLDEISQRLSGMLGTPYIDEKYSNNDESQLNEISQRLSEVIGD